VDRNVRPQAAVDYLRDVALLAEGVDRNPVRPSSSQSGAWVALLAEGVDRNGDYIKAPAPGGQSPSSRRAWIEIQK